VSIPTLLDQTFPIEPSNDDDDSRDSQSVLLQTSIAKPGDENDQRISVLEAEVEKSNKVATESLQELSKEKLKRSDLENRIEQLELALAMEMKNMTKIQVIHQNDDDDAKSILDSEYHGRMLEIAKKERDDALDLVREIRKINVRS
jgi:hypothetical protein